MTYERGGDKCTMKEWIDSIEANTSPHAISRVDQKVDGSVGRLRNRVEKILNTNRQVPIFEFRRLAGSQPAGFESRVKEIRGDIVTYHGQFANAARLMRRKPNAKYSHIRRDGATTACVASTGTTQGTTETPPPTTIAPSMPSCSLQNMDPDAGILSRGCVCGSTTLPLLTITGATDASQSCSYTAMPSSSVTNPITVEHHTYTTNCYLCTLIGGIADNPSCGRTPVSGCTPTTPATPTATVFLSNNSVPVGNENNKNNGTDLRNELFEKLRDLCPADEGECDSKTAAEIDNIEAIVKDEYAQEKLKFIIQDSHYDSIEERDIMISSVVAVWQQAVAQTCKEVEYEDYEQPDESGCGDGPVRRGLVKRALMTPEERKNNPRTPAPCDDCDPVHPPKCQYKATVCSGPDHISRGTHLHEELHLC